MNKNEKIGLISGAVTGLLAGGYVAWLYKKLDEENTRLKADNLTFLRNTLIMVTSQQRGETIPLHLLQDLEFRRMAAMVEFFDDDVNKTRDDE